MIIKQYLHCRAQSPFTIGLLYIYIKPGSNQQFSQYQFLNPQSTLYSRVKRVPFSAIYTYKSIYTYIVKPKIQNHGANHITDIH